MLTGFVITSSNERKGQQCLEDHLSQNLALISPEIIYLFVEIERIVV